MISLHRYRNLVDLYHKERHNLTSLSPFKKREKKPVIFDANKYKLHIPTVKRLYERDKDTTSLDDIVNVISLSTSMPIMASILWIQCLYGTNKEIEDKINSYQKYYSYDTILPVTYTLEGSNETA